MIGGSIVMTTSYQQVSPTAYGATHMNIRSASGNSTVWISADGVTPCGFLNAGEARQFRVTSPHLVWVKGTAGNRLYWDAV